MCTSMYVHVHTYQTDWEVGNVVNHVHDGRGDSRKDDIKKDTATTPDRRLVGISNNTSLRELC